MHLQEPRGISLRWASGGGLVRINLRGSTNLLRVIPTVQVATSPHGRIINSWLVAQTSKILDHTKNNSVLLFWSSGRRTVRDQQCPCLPVAGNVGGCRWVKLGCLLLYHLEKHLFVTQRRHSTFASCCISTDLTVTKECLYWRDYDWRENKRHRKEMVEWKILNHRKQVALSWWPQIQKAKWKQKVDFQHLVCMRNRCSY